MAQKNENMDFSAICRICIGTKFLNPIFKDENDYSLYSTAVFISTGLKVDLNDGLPQQMCKNCIKFINDSLKFRKQCKDSEMRLLEIKNSKTFPVSGKVLKNIDHSKTILKKEKTNESTKGDCIYIKIEEFTLENDDEPLKNLLKYTNVENVKIETREIKNDHETDTNDFVKSLIKTDLDIEESTLQMYNTDELKQEVEYLDDQFESESRHLVTYIKDEASKSVNFLNGVTYTATTPPPLITIETNESNLVKNSVTTSEEILGNVTNNSNSKRNRYNIDTYIKDTVTNSDESNNIANTDMPFIIRDSNRVTCKLCQKDLSKRSIDLHISKRHPGADTRRVKCDLCDTYVFKQRLNRHRIKMHGRDCFRCGYCKTEFDSKDVLLDHIQTCTAKKRKRQTTDKRKEQKVECDVCHKMMQKASLRMHQEIKHAGMGPVCERCGRRFGNKFRLEEHLRAKHGYEKFKCSVCEFRSASSMGLRNHERRHHGELPFACTSCSARFDAPNLLAQHKQKHRTEKLMKCDLCPASFNTNNSLHMHKTTCHDAPIYQCNMCMCTYRCRHYAVKHLRNVHRYMGPVGSLQLSSTRNMQAGGEGSELDAEPPTVVALVQRVDGSAVETK